MNKEDWLIKDLTRYRDRLREIHETETSHARRGATHSRLEDTLSALSHYFGNESEIGKLIEEIRQLYYECDFHERPAAKEEGVRIPPGHSVSSALDRKV